MKKSKLKSFIKLFIPPIAYKIRNLFCKREYSATKHFSEFSENVKRNDKLFIFGNGPSFAESFEKYKIFFDGCDILAVNDFVKTTLFKIVKPNLYMLADPTFFVSEPNNLADYLRDQLLYIIDLFNNNLTWKIELFIPDFGCNSYLHEHLSNNKYISFNFYNTRKLKEVTSDNKFDLWERNLLPPPAQTVLNVCLYLGIKLNYQNIYILGLDMTWHEDLELDQKTNQLFIIDKHFYGSEKRLAHLDINGKTPAKVHEYLQCSVNALKSFWELREWADYKNIRVVNCSSHSWVDAFERG